MHEDRALVIQRSGRKDQTPLKGGEDLGPARVADEAPNLVPHQAQGRKNATDAVPDMLGDEGRDRAIKDDAKAGIVDVLTHDVGCRGPRHFAALADYRERVVRAAPDEAGRSPVAKQRRGDDIGLAHDIEPDRSGAKLHRNEEDDAPRRGQRQPGRDGETRRSARTTEAEDRNAMNVGSKSHAAQNPHLYARRRDAGGRYGDQCVDLIGGTPASASALSAASM